MKNTPMVLLFSVLICSAAIAGRPNFVIIMADDLGYGDLSCYGNTAYETPHIDALAAAGIRLTDFHSNGNVCSPTRAALLTGRYQQRAGISDVVFADPNRSTHTYGLQTQEFTFAEAMKSAGYLTAIAGKWHQGYYVSHNPTMNGFDQFEGYVSGNVDFISHIDGHGRFDWWIDKTLARKPGYTTHLITQKAIDFIENSKNQPFCLYVAHEAPHYPYQGPADPALRVEGKIGKDDYSKSDIDKREAYREMVQEMDEGVGQIVATLVKHNLSRNTLVLFCSDNGAVALGSNGKWRGFKGTNWEGGHRVPCVASWSDRIKPGSVARATAMTMDIMPTLLEAADMTLPTERPLDGVSLLGMLTQHDKLAPRDLFWWRNHTVAMRRGEWKLLLSAKAGRASETATFLANLQSDPTESTNLADQHPERVRRMQADIAAWQQRVTTDATPQP